MQSQERISIVSLQPAKFCVSILPRSPSEVDSNLKTLREADIVELRLDLLKDLELQDIIKKVRKPIIVTLRTSEEWGFWEGTVQQRCKIFQKAIDYEVDYVDIEWKSAQAILPQLKLNNKTKLILSHHTSENKLDRLLAILEKMVGIKADIYKLIFGVNHFNDNSNLFYLLEEAKKYNIRYVIHAGGELGIVSRLIGSIMGNEIIYLAVAEEIQTADGQLTLAQMKSDYFINEKSKSTKIIGLLGYPIQQSVGWKLHNRLLHEKQATKSSLIRIDNFLYVKFPVKSFKKFWKTWNRWIAGLSVTIPHKETVVSYISFISQSVKDSGVCNTLIKRAKGWWGFNTDMIAMFEILKPLCIKFGKGVLVFGTGATARSAIAAMKKLDINPIIITGRNSDRAEFLKDLFKIEYVPLGNLQSTNVSGIIQTTPVGMFPNVDQIPPLDSLLANAEVVFDVVFNPRLTRFLQLARDKDCQIVSGEEMFIRQAMRQFSLFSGVECSLDNVRKIWREISAEL
jgi:3-dehydroquinate dehydratase/shikimate dehydrogenase